METVLITGANRGLGLEFCRQYAEAGWKVLACCRDPGAADALNGLAGRHPGAVEVLALDVADFQAVDALARRLDGTALDVLLCNAGIYGDAPGAGFGALDYDVWARVLRINTLAPMKLAEAFLPHLQRGARKQVVALTSLMGSIADNGSGGSILYRSSKAGLNAAMKSLAIDLKGQGIGVLLLHPGWVQTDMGGPNAPTLPQASVSGMRQVIGAFRPEDSGRFLDFQGRQLPW